MSDPQAGPRIASLDASAVPLADMARLVRESIRKRPTARDPRLELARLLSEQGKLQEAAQVLTTQVRLFPEDARAWRDRCWIHGRLRNYPAALADLEKLVQLGEDVSFELSQVALGLMHICDWSQLARPHKLLQDRFSTGASCLVDPYAILAVSDDPREHLRMARCIALSLKNEVCLIPSL